MSNNPTSPGTFTDTASARSDVESAREDPLRDPGTTHAKSVATDRPAAEGPSAVQDPSLPDDHPLQRTTAAGGTADAPLLQRYRGEATSAAPSVWFMRQAGRSLPEYRELRANIGMIDACLRPDLAAEITAQPVRRHQVDAGIFFSDIVVPLRLAGLEVEIEAGVGPVFTKPVNTAEAIAALPALGDDFEQALVPIREAVRLTVDELGSTPLIGFAGAPFTVASYLVEGKPSRDHLAARALMRSEPELWQQLASWVADASGRFLRAQVLAGASAVQVFDSWAGSLSAESYLAGAAPFTQSVFSHVQDLPVPRVHFAVGAAHLLPQMHATGATVTGVDHRVRLGQALQALPPGTPVQGNLDPSVLFTSEQVRFAEADRVLAEGAAAAGHVVNLGHGVPPTTDPYVLTDLVAYLHSQSPSPRGAAKSDAAKTSVATDGSETTPEDSL